MTTTADRLIALACAFLDRDPSPHTRAQEILDWAEERQRLALAEQQSCPRCNGLGAIHIHYSEDGKRQCDPCPVCKPKVWPQHSATIEEARRRAHQAAENQYERGYPVSYCINAALDAFIAAMPRHEPASVPPAPVPQPEGVPEEVHAEAHNAAVYSGGAPEKVVRAVTMRVWNAARQFGPVPPKVTEEMALSLRNALQPEIGMWPAVGICMRALEAAFAAASPKDTDQ